MNTILIAGIGNIFLGDDAFGVEVARRLLECELPPDVLVKDFGIRGIDLTYALLEEHDAVILIDAAVRGEPPGTLSMIEPDAPPREALEPGDVLLSAHALDPAKVMQIVAALGGRSRRIVLIACEPLDCGGEEGHIGLSAPVAAAVEPAVEMIKALIGDLRNVEARAA